MNIDGTFFNIHAMAPYKVKKLRPAEHLTGSFNQDRQQAKFLWAQHQHMAGPLDLHSVWK
jgi:hypothetical protein